MYTASNYYDKDSIGSEKRFDLVLYFTIREEKTWISRFCSRQENCYFCKVDYEFISDSFNLFGINNTVHLYRQALKLNTVGSCPRVCCKHQHLLPIGESDNPGVSTVKLFCPCCKEIYYPPPEFERTF